MKGMWRAQHGLLQTFVTGSLQTGRVGGATQQCPVVFGTSELRVWENLSNWLSWELVDLNPELHDSGQQALSTGQHPE